MMIERLRAAHLSKLPISLRDEQHAVVSSLTDSKEAPRYLIIPGGDAATASAGGGEDEVDLFSPSGYASHPAITVLHFLQNMHLDHPSYVQQTVALAEQFGRDIPSIGLLERRDLVDYLTGVSSTSTRIITSSSSSHSSKSGITSSATASLPVSSLDPMDVDNDDVASAKKRPKLMDGALGKVNEDKDKVKEIVKKERTIKNSQTILTIQSNKNFASIQKIGFSVFVRNAGSEKVSSSSSSAAKHSSSSSSSRQHHHKSGAASSSSSSTHPRKQTSSKPAAAATSSSSKAASSAASKKSASKDSSIPIIVVPAAAQSNITLYNVKDFLQDGKYILSEVRRNEIGVKPTMVTLTRPPNASSSSPTEYHIYDAVDKFTDAEWNRVVAVFASGHDWQFKNWSKWKHPVDIFNNVRGFYLKYNDEPAKDTVKNWNVAYLVVHRNRRHLDGQTCTEFWNEIDKWGMNRRK